MKYSYIIFLFVIGLVSCKKKETTTTNTNTPDTYGYNSSLTITEQNTLNNNNALTFNSSFATAKFVKVNLNFPRQVGISFNIDSVLFNNKLLHLYYNPNEPYLMAYTDTIPLTPYPPFVWNIRGSSEYPSYKDTITDSIPKFTKYSSIPDSISQSGNTSLVLGSTNADSIYIGISGSQGSGWGKTLPSTTSSITVSNANWLTLTTTGKISFTCFKQYSKMVGSDKINYKISSEYTKTISIVP
ncbi:MAG TPA: hypothetical protein VF411_07525 [Bacteroidia bacterium]